MPNTARLGWPYPASTDAPKGNEQIQELAEKLDTIAGGITCRASGATTTPVTQAQLTPVPLTSINFQTGPEWKRNGTSLVAPVTGIYLAIVNTNYDSPSGSTARQTSGLRQGESGTILSGGYQAAGVNAVYIQRLVQVTAGQDLTVLARSTGSGINCTSCEVSLALVAAT